MPVRDSVERLPAPTSDARDHSSLEHLARYRWAATIARGRVLDAACGTGYGTAMLSEVADEAHGVDYAAEAVAEAARLAPRATITRATLPELPYPDEHFDTVVSFETIEHI